MGSCGALGGRIMDPWRLATRAQRRINTLAGLALASCVRAWLAGFGSAPIERVSASAENAGAVSILERREPSLIASTALTDMPQAIVAANAAGSSLEAAAATQSAPEKATDTTASLDEPKPVVVASLPDPSQAFPPEAPSAGSATAGTPDPAPEKVTDTTASVDEPKSFVVASLTDPSQVFPPEEVATAPDTAVPAVSTIEINEECLVVEICIDRYLWALYERAPKVDAIALHERKKVTMKRKGKTVT